jgi:chromosome partitioning protein
VIFRELFLSGLTLLDLKATGEALSMSQVAARQEVRELLRVLALPGVDAAAA